MAVFIFSPTLADDSDKLQDLEKKIAEYEEKISQARSQQRTLASTIEVLNNQIYLTTARINKTTKDIEALQEQIKELGTKINKLDRTLNDVGLILGDRIGETYKRSFLPSIYLVFSASDFTDFISRMKYLKTIQKHDKELMFSMEETKLNFDAQKELKRTKQEELESLENELKAQGQQLGQQKYAKQNLLEITKNDEANFQNLLAQAKSEYEAIQAIIAHRGSETPVGPVKKGDRIASVIEGASCNSSGAHLHFTVVDQNNNTKNPFEFLQGGVEYENCTGPGACSEGDPFNPSGSWSWPVSPKIHYNQGYGSTWAVNNTWVGQVYSFHNGIDISGSSVTVMAVTDGELSRGSYTGGGGCRLRYVRVDHDDSELSTLYLHVNY
jgi:peptidoglycan hydrolase CwlO-like protein